MPGFFAFVDEAAYMFEEQGKWQEGLAPNYPYPYPCPCPYPFPYPFPYPYPYPYPYP